MPWQLFLAGLFQKVPTQTSAPPMPPPTIIILLSLVIGINLIQVLVLSHTDNNGNNNEDNHHNTNNTSNHTDADNSSNGGGSNNNEDHNRNGSCKPNPNANPNTNPNCASTAAISIHPDTIIATARLVTTIAFALGLVARPPVELMHPDFKQFLIQSIFPTCMAQRLKIKLLLNSCHGAVVAPGAPAGFQPCWISCTDSAD